MRQHYPGFLPIRRALYNGLALVKFIFDAVFCDFAAPVKTSRKSVSADLWVEISSPLSKANNVTERAGLYASVLLAACPG